MGTFFRLSGDARLHEHESMMRSGVSDVNVKQSAIAESGRKKSRAHESPA